MKKILAILLLLLFGLTSGCRDSLSQPAALPTQTTEPTQTSLTSGGDNGIAVASTEKTHKDAAPVSAETHSTGSVKMSDSYNTLNAEEAAVILHKDTERMDG